MRVFILLLLLLVVSCSEESAIVNNDVIPQDLNSWYVDEDDIGGGITNFPLMDEPEFISVSEMEGLNVLNDDAKLGLLKINNVVYAFPYDFTNRYEVVNGTFGDKHLAITYCPLTQSGLCFDRVLESNEIVTLKASGYLYNNNLIPNDINSNRFYSQMTTKVIKGDDSVLRLDTYNMLETNWNMVKTTFPNALVFKHDEVVLCVECDPSNSPFNNNNLFGVLHEHVFNDIVYLFDMDNFSNATRFENLSINNRNAIIVGNKSKSFINAFYVPAGIEFSVISESLFPLILSDNEGNKWDIFGFAIEGPRTGSNLEHPKSYFSTQSDWENMFNSLIYR